MRPITEVIPKVLIPVNGEPFAAHLLRLLASRGVDRCVLCIGHLGELVRDAIGDGSSFGIRVAYSEDGPVRLGTAGAIKRALPLLGERFLLTYGDSYLPADYAAIERHFIASEATGLMTVWHNRGELATSNVSVRDGRIVAYRKGAADPSFEYIDYGISGFSRSSFDSTPGDLPTDLGDVVRTEIANGTLAMFEIFERFHEIGSPEGLEETERYLLDRKVESHGGH